MDTSPVAVDARQQEGLVWQSMVQPTKLSRLSARQYRRCRLIQRARL